MCIRSWRVRIPVVLLILLIAAAACSEGPVLAPTATPAELSPSATAAVDPLLQLPAAFHYEVRLQPAEAGEEAATIITGAYRDGALTQTARQADGTAEELIIAAGPADGAFRSFTRPADQERWARWPGVGFDAVYGLASPFSPLRLYPLVLAQVAPAEPDLLLHAPVETFRAQVVFSPEIIERFLKAGVAAVTSDAEEQEALALQLAPLLVPQTFTYWTSEDGRVYQAAATLLTADLAGRPAPWLAVVWRYWGYDDPAIAVAAPTAFDDVSELVSPPGATAAAPAAGDEAALAPDTTLRVRVFANPGRYATDTQVIVYPAGKKQAQATQLSADAQFALPPGVYDVFVQAEAAWTWLRDVVVSPEALSSHDVLFDFGTLTLVVTHQGATPQVDIVVYPAGQRQEWLAWRTENPTTLHLPAGPYDVEVALPDLSATKRVSGIEVKASQTTEVTIALDEP